MAEGGNSFGRRTLIKTALKWGAAATAAGLGYRPVTEYITDRNIIANRNEEGMKRLYEESGVADIFPVWKARNDFYNTYGVYPPIGNINDLASMAHSIATGYENNTMLDLVHNGWAEKKADVKELAQQKVESIKVKIDEGLEDTPEFARNAYRKLAEIFPANVLAAPNMLHIVHGGGSIKQPTFEDQDGALKIESPKKDLEGFFRSGMHELMHAAESWQRIKPYVTRKEYADYLAYETQALKDIFDQFANLPWDEARKIKDLDKGIMPEHVAPEISKITQEEERLKKEYGLDIDEAASCLPDLQGDKTYRYSRLIWFGAHYRKMMHENKLSEKEKQQVMGKEDKFLRDYEISYLLSRVGNDLLHFFVGPVQREGGGLTGLGIAPEYAGKFIPEMNKKVQLARFKAFSTLPPDTLDNFDVAAQIVRQSFGLPNAKSEAVKKEL